MITSHPCPSSVRPFGELSRASGLDPLSARLGVVTAEDGEASMFPWIAGGLLLVAFLAWRILHSAILDDRRRAKERPRSRF
jgi:hypothetical protein